MRRSPGCVALLIFVVLLAVASPVAAAPEGQLTWAVQFALAPTWFDPAETTGIITPFFTLYAIHDALVKPMPGKPMAPSLAESWSASPDGLTYDFVLRAGVRFHNGDPLTADDVKFSFERYRGVSAKLFKDRVRQVQVVDPLRVRFHLKEPWPDFMAFYATPATGAAWIVPRKHVEKVGEDGFKRAPVGAGPYRFVSFAPGTELVLEANEHYWRKPPSVKRLVIKVVPDETTRLAMLKRGEVDLAYTFRGAVAEELKRSPGLGLKPSLFNATFWVIFTEQWDPKSPWADRRVRLAANHAIDRQAINESLDARLLTDHGQHHSPGLRVRVARPDVRVRSPPRRQLLAEAGYPNGFDAGQISTDTSFAESAEPIANYFAAIGIRASVRALERAAFFNQLRDKKLRPLAYAASGAYGNAATRLDAFVAAGGAYAYGSYPDLEGLIQEQALDRDRKRREATLVRIQQMMYDRAMFAPLWETATINGVRPARGRAGAEHDQRLSVVGAVRGAASQGAVSARWTS